MLQPVGHTVNLGFQSLTLRSLTLSLKNTHKHTHTFYLYQN